MCGQPIAADDSCACFPKPSQAAPDTPNTPADSDLFAAVCTPDLFAAICMEQARIDREIELHMQTCEECKARIAEEEGGAR